SRLEERDGACPCPDCRLPRQGPPADLREKAVTIWCGTYYAELATEMGQDAAEECASAFAYGFEKGITTAIVRTGQRGPIALGAMPLAHCCTPDN
ncbi:MAG: hypothetical protein V3S20_11060, partial [Dehalococcoidia bacterium]